MKSVQEKMITLLLQLNTSNNPFLENTKRLKTHTTHARMHKRTHTEDSYSDSPVELHQFITITLIKLNMKIKLRSFVKSELDFTLLT